MITLAKTIFLITYLIYFLLMMTVPRQKAMGPVLLCFLLNCLAQVYLIVNGIYAYAIAFFVIEAIEACVAGVLHTKGINPSVPFLRKYLNRNKTNFTQPGYYFESSIDLSDVNDSMELESGEEIARLTIGNLCATVETRGDIRVFYKDTIYKSPGRFPKELMSEFHNGTAYDNPEINVSYSNWFELFLWETGEDGTLHWTGISDVVDVEGYSKEEMESFLYDCITEHQKDRNIEAPEIAH